MTTTIFQVSLSDGSVFKVLCLNRSQIKRFAQSLEKVRPELELNHFEACKGFHSIKQWEELSIKL